MDKMEKTSLTSFEKAIQSLQDAITAPSSPLKRDAIIQRFEYTYGLAVKMIARYFEQKGLAENVDALDYNDFCRIAAEAELVDNPKDWFEYRKARNMTSHAYDEALAEKVYTSAFSFLPEARQLLERLKKHL